MTELRRRVAVVRTGLGALQVDALGVDLASPLTDGLVRLTSGRLPRAAHEVTVNAALASHGFQVGDRLTLAGGTSATVVGIAESTSDAHLAVPGRARPTSSRPRATPAS